MVGFMGLGLFKLNMHLGKPHRFYRGFNNLRLSPVSREIAGVTAFFTGLLGYSFFSLFDYTLTHILANFFAGLGLIGVAAGSYYMYKLYRIPARPFWDHWQTASAFYGTMLALGSLLVAISVTLFADSAEHSALIQTLALLAFTGLSIEAIGLLIHARDLKQGSGEAAAAHYGQTTHYGKTYILRNSLLGINLIGLFVLSFIGISDSLSLIFASLLVVSVLLMSYLERIIFYALVIPTTMPGAFFWRNKGFVEHARETGLADREQVGVVYEGHHKFNTKELLQTLKENSPKDMFNHVKWIFTGK